MTNYLSFDIEDWFHVENFKPYISRENWNTCSLRVPDNTARILDILSCFGIKATFFVLGWVAHKCPELVKSIDAQGHEIASHGFWHNLVYRQTKDEFRKDILLSKKILEGIIQKEVIGYRAPSFSITNESLWALDILRECGFKYDSSIFPTSFHNRYGFHGVNSGGATYANGIVEVPMSTYSFLNTRLPLGGGGYFRLFPYSYFKVLFKALNRKGEAFVFYLHPWELDENQPHVNACLSYRFRHYVNLKNTQKKFKRLIQDFKFQPLRKVVNS